MGVKAIQDLRSLTCFLLKGTILKYLHQAGGPIYYNLLFNYLETNYL